MSLRQPWLVLLWLFIGLLTHQGIAQAQTELSYVEFTTAGAEEQAKLPMVVAIHGLGDSPENFSRFLRRFPAQLRVIALRAPTPYHRGYSWFPIRASSGGKDPALIRGVQKATVQILETVRRLLSQRPTVGRPLVLGFSQGGILSFSLAASSPRLFKAVFPIAGMLPDQPLSAGVEKTKVYAFHGGSDRIIPISGSERAVLTLKNRGYPTQLYRYSKLGHHFSSRLISDLFEAIEGELPSTK